MEEYDIDEEEFWEECPVCGYSDSEYELGDCDCCYECDQSVCQCLETFGCMPDTPWGMRGAWIYGGINKTRQQAWPDLIVNDFWVTALVAEFYLLEAIAHDVLSLVKEPGYTDALFEVLGIDGPLKDRLIALESKPAMAVKQAEIKQKELIENFEPCIYAYMQMIVGGELRYHRACNAEGFGTERSDAWVEWANIVRAIGSQAFLDAQILFDDFGSDSYGGEAWSDIAQVVYQRMEGKLGPNDYINRKLFLDRVFTLEHNSGTVFNKLDHWDTGGLSAVLEAHGNSNLKKLASYSGEEVRKLYDDYIGV